MLIGGVPNVGKSTIINSLRQRDSEITSTRKSGAKTGVVPCVTKSLSGFRIITDPPIFLVDSPGIITPKIKTAEEGLKLCACHSIRDGIEDAELVCDYVLFTLNKQK